MCWQHEPADRRSSRNDVQPVLSASPWPTCPSPSPSPCPDPLPDLHPPTLHRLLMNRPKCDPAIRNTEA
eukprot:6173774-Pleurochrysis_carterae.AAC.2